MSFHHSPATKSPRDFLRCDLSQSTVFHLCFLPLLFSRRMYIRQPSSGAFCLFLSPPDGQELIHDLRKASLKSWTSATIRQVARAPLYCSVGNQFNVLVASQPCQGYICYPDQAIAPSRTCFSSNVAQLSNWSLESCKLSWIASVTCDISYHAGSHLCLRVLALPQPRLALIAV